MLRSKDQRKRVIQDGMRMEFDVPIPMDDGIVLRADVYAPIDEGRYPVILSHGPYAKGLAFQEGYRIQWERMVAEHPDVAAGSTNKYQTWEAVDPEKWVPDGYVCVRVDSRGAGRSPGIIDVWSPRETKDFYDCIEWAAVQPWSNGRIGLAGISYYAMNQYQVAALQPPHLVAMCPWEGASDFYREMCYHGGIRSQFPGRWFPRQISTVQYGLGDRGARSVVTGEPVAGPQTLHEDELKRNRVEFGEEIEQHPFMDAWFRERNADWSKVKTPMLSAGNWGGQGLHLRGNVEAFTQAASHQKWLEVHGLEHWTHFYTDYGTNLQKEFFDHFLKGLDNGWDKSPRVRLNVRHADGTFLERDEHEWPLARTRWTRYFLDLDRRALSGAPIGSEQSVTYEAAAEGVTLRTPPFAEPTEFTGPAMARLFVSSTTSDADIFLVVRIFDPEGGEITFQGALDPNTPVTQGWLRASHRKLDPKLSKPYRPYHSHDERQMLQPGKPVEL
ncbi:MAG: CocE/NonD family hydrolase, partial [Methylobacteriaceae bacterium]|nr:CocE/NonD family hydrolase [Methylobacteriaceae bacterium]